VRSDVVIYNASARTRGPLLELIPADVQRSLQVTAYGAFLVAQQAARRMVPKGYGAILFTGASASVKGYARSAPFAMGKFAVRGLAQSMARELAPQGIHVAHFVIDGAIRPPGHTEDSARPDSMLDPDAIASTFINILRQPRSACTREVELRPWVESFLRRRHRGAGGGTPEASAASMPCSPCLVVKPCAANVHASPPSVLHVNESTRQSLRGFRGGLFGVAPYSASGLGRSWMW
jgi:NAD(P)-dependent dehydrogenase (short-subunit alcohol dehydrogenase family)